MDDALNLPLWGILVCAYVAADILMPSVIRFSRRIGAFDHPGGHKAQKHPTPYLGGIGVFTAIVIALAIALKFDRTGQWIPLVGIPLGGIFVLVLGLLDDWKPVNAMIKLLLLFLASLVVIGCGVKATLFTHTWHIVPNILVSLLWIAGITSAFNSLDNTDGAVGGTAAIAAAGVCAITLLRTEAAQDPHLIALACAIVGASVGFLRYNWPHARIYLGNNGSFFIGFTLASLLLFAPWSVDPLRAAIIPCVLMTVPLLDISLSTFLRYRQGVVRTIREAIVYCGHDHMAHRLQALGMSRPGASATIWAIAGLSACQALVLCKVRSQALFWLVLAGHAGCITVVSAILARAPVYGQRRRNDAPAHRSSELVLSASRLAAQINARTAPPLSARAPNASHVEPPETQIPRAPQPCAVPTEPKALVPCK